MPAVKGGKVRGFPGFGDRVKEKALALGYKNLNEFARERKIDKSNVYAWAKDRAPGFANLKRLRDELGVPWEWLVIGNDGMKVLEEWQAAGRPIKPKPVAIAGEPKRKQEEKRRAAR